MTPSAADHRHTIGISRREWLQVGYSGLLSVSIPTLLARRAIAAAANRPGGQASRKPKAVVLVFLTGAPSHLDTFDMKPEAPPEVRGEFQSIATKVPGLRICEHLPRLAARADRYALVRSLAHREYNHLVATHHVLTGHPQPGAFFDKVASRDDWPCYASADRPIKVLALIILSGTDVIPSTLNDVRAVWRKTKTLPEFGQDKQPV